MPATSTSRQQWTWALTILLLSGVGCAQLGEGGIGGGGSNLPNRGVAGYELADDEDGGSVVLSRDLLAVTDIGSPSATVLDGDLLLFVDVHTDTDSRILRFDGTSELNTDAAAVTVEGAAGSMRDVNAMSLNGAITLTWIDGAGAIVMTELDAAMSPLPETQVVFAPQPPPGGTISSPSLAWNDEGRRVLFYEVTQEVDGLKSSYIVRATDHGAGFATDGRVLSAGEGCTDPDGEEAVCWDWVGTGDPEVRRVQTSTGRMLWRMTYRGTGSFDAHGLGFAFSEDGYDWARYPYNPVFDRSSLQERNPTNVRHAGDWLIWFVELDGSDPSGIGFATNSLGVSSEEIVYQVAAP